MYVCIFYNLLRHNASKFEKSKIVIVWPWAQNLHQFKSPLSDLTTQILSKTISYEVTLTFTTLTFRDTFTISKFGWNFNWCRFWICALMLLPEPKGILLCPHGWSTMQCTVQLQGKVFSPSDVWEKIFQPLLLYFPYGKGTY